MLSDTYLLVSENFARDYTLHLEDYRNPANAGKIDEFFQTYYEQKIAAIKDIYWFDGVDAHISINGPMSPNGPDLYDVFYGYGGVAYTDILGGISQAISDVDPGKGKLYFHGNTPGGTVSMVDDVYQAIKTCGLRTVMINEGSLCSGGVWLGSACDEIIASTPVAFTGSIGVVIRTYDISGMLEKMGVKEVVITNHEASEKAPNIGSTEGQKVVQEELGAIYSVFRDRVVAGRNGKINAATIDSLKGGVKVAKDAMEIGLIDQIIESSGKNNYARAMGAKKPTRAQATATPASTGETSMDLKQLKAEHPDLVEAITAEARDGMITKEDHTKQLTAATAAGAESERARIADVRAQAIPGYEEMVDKMAFDGVSTGADAALAIVGKEKALRQRAATQMDDEANDPAPPANSEDGAGKTMKRSAFNKLDHEARAAFLHDGGKLTD
jgi:ClpP class serine protease